MGPNGSGKSTLAYALMGHPSYEITEGEILLDGESIVEEGADVARSEGALPRLPVPARDPGVTVTSFLRSAINAIRKAKNGGKDDPIPVKEFRTEILAAMERLKVPRELASRYLNDGFSGGEKKRARSSRWRCSSRDRDPRRDRLRPRHRRPADRRERRQRARQRARWARS